MKKLVLALAVAAMCGLGVSCSKPDANVPQSVIDHYPKVKSIAEEGSLTTVLNKKGDVLGYVLNSKPASDSIMGFKGETPLEIYFDGNKTVMKVVMLPNQETENFANKVVTGGLLDSWNGLGVEDALAKEVDVVSGATYTSKGVIGSFQAALKANMQ